MQLASGSVGTLFIRSRFLIILGCLSQCSVVFQSYHIAVWWWHRCAVSVASVSLTLTLSSKERFVSSMLHLTPNIHTATWVSKQSQLWSLRFRGASPLFPWSWSLSSYPAWGEKVKPHHGALTALSRWRRRFKNPHAPRASVCVTVPSIHIISSSVPSRISLCVKWKDALSKSKQLCRNWLLPSDILITVKMLEDGSGCGDLS